VRCSDERFIYCSHSTYISNSEATKERFIEMYRLPEMSITASPARSYAPLPGHSPANNRRSPPPSPTSRRVHNKSQSLDVGAIEAAHLAKLSRPKMRATPSAPADGELARAAIKSKTKDRSLFNATMLELVKFIQASLLLFGFLSIDEDEIDGLLCDDTVEGIQRWVAEVGEQCVGVEPMQSVADPMAVAALLSLVLALRNKLAAIGWAHVCLVISSVHHRVQGFFQVVPKDPFFHPNKFKAAIASYTQSMNIASHHSSPHTHSQAPFLSMSPGASAAPLTRPLVDSISAAYDKSRSNDSRKVHRVLLNKLDDLTSVVAGDRGDKGGLEVAGAGTSAAGIHVHADEAWNGRGHGAGGQLLSGIGSLASGLKISVGVISGGGPAAVLEPTMDLEDFVRAVISGRAKDQHTAPVAASVRGLWSGRVASVVKMREREREREMLSWLERKERSAKGDYDRFYVEGDRDSEREGTDGGKSTEGESEVVGHGLGRHWPERVQKKIGSWAG
jgi:hypothetical protein